MGLSLARPSDVELVPALVEDDDAFGWDSVIGWAASSSTREATRRARLLALPCADPRATSRPGVTVKRGPLRRRQGERPIILDLTSLWAGPLCAHLLGLTGAAIVKVESSSRPDGARFGSAEFFDTLHRGHEMVSLDFADPAGREDLRQLALKADLVLEASRPRALRRLGLVAEEFVDAGTSWLSITAAGRDSDAVGFGDDVAVGAGLHLLDGGEVLPCGDAIADPLTGVTAAAAAAEALNSDRAQLIDVSMHDVAAEAAVGEIQPHRVLGDGHGAWWVETSEGQFPVCPPTRCPR